MNPLPAKPRDSAVSIPMMRTLADLTRGPAFRLDNWHYQGTAPGRMFIRRRTMAALKNFGWVTATELPGNVLRYDLTEHGRAFLLQHPLRMALGLAR